MTMQRARSRGLRPDGIRSIGIRKIRFRKIHIRAIGVAVAAIALVAVQVPCGLLGAPAALAGSTLPGVEVARVASTPAMPPCAAHAGAPPPEPSEWLEQRCPCGCGDGAPPGSGAVRAGPALPFDTLARLPASQPLRAAGDAPRLRSIAPSPAEPVPLHA